MSDLACSCLSFTVFCHRVHAKSGYLHKRTDAHRCKNTEGEKWKETVYSSHSWFPAGHGGSSQATEFVLLECVVFSVWIKVRVTAGGHAGAWSCPKPPLSLPVCLLLLTPTLSHTQHNPPVKESRHQLYRAKQHAHTTPANLQRLLNYWLWHSLFQSSPWVGDRVRLNVNCSTVQPCLHTQSWPTGR